jgi:hypothetical protein
MYCKMTRADWSMALVSKNRTVSVAVVMCPTHAVRTVEVPRVWR